MLHIYTSLRERLRILFLEQGITVATLLTAIDMCISSIVLAITGHFNTTASTSTSTTIASIPATTSSWARVKEWIKQRLQDLGRLLTKLAGKIAAALPGIVGGILSWLLNFLSKAAVWTAGNLWSLLVALGGLLLLAARAWLAKKPQSK